MQSECIQKGDRLSFTLFQTMKSFLNKQGTLLEYKSLLCPQRKDARTHLKPAKLLPLLQILVYPLHQDEDNVMLT